jgi:hypothetical protein
VADDLDDIMAAPSAQDEKTKKKSNSETITRVVLDEEEGEVVVHEYSDSEEDADTREKRKAEELEKLQKEEQKKKQKKERKQKEDSDFIVDEADKPAKKPKRARKPAEEVPLLIPLLFSTL